MPSSTNKNDSSHSQEESRRMTRSDPQSDLSSSSLTMCPEASPKHNSDHTETVGSNLEVQHQLLNQNSVVRTNDGMPSSTNKNDSSHSQEELQTVTRSNSQSDLSSSSSAPAPVREDQQSSTVSPIIADHPPTKEKPVTVSPSTPPMVKRIRKRLIQDLRDNSSSMSIAEKAENAGIAKKLCRKDSFLCKAIEDAEIPDSPGNVKFVKMLNSIQH